MAKRASGPSWIRTPSSPRSVTCQSRTSVQKPATRSASVTSMHSDVIRLAIGPVYQGEPTAGRAPVTRRAGGHLLETRQEYVHPCG